MSRRKRDGETASPGHAGLEQRLLARLKRLRVPRGASILVGFSGGADSIALSAALGRVAPVVGVSVDLLHVDHALRPSSASEAARAMVMARRLGLTCTVTRLDPDAIAAHKGVGGEEAARRQRYRVLTDELHRRGAAVVALAHHQSDQAETVLLHLLRGAGVHGAAGMAERSTLIVPWWEERATTPSAELPIWRPLLFETRSAVRDYTTGLGLDPIEDPSNAHTAFRRNAIRHEVMPLLERISPGATAALARHAALAADADAVLRSLAEHGLAGARVDERRLAIRALIDLHPAVRRTAMLIWLQSFMIEAGLERVDAVLDLLDQPSADRVVEIGRGSCARVRNGLLEIGECEAFAANRAAMA